MGYTSDFTGYVTVEPPLNESEVAFLSKFSGTRRMHRDKGPYYVDNAGFAGQDREDDILDYNRPPEGQPSLWCSWAFAGGDVDPGYAPDVDFGSAIFWDGAEKFYCSSEWMAYIINHFLKPGAVASTSGDPQFKDFTFNHTVNGEISVQGEDAEDVWRIVVEDTVVKVAEGYITYGTPEAVLYEAQ